MKARFTILFIIVFSVFVQAQNQRLDPDCSGGLISIPGFVPTDLVIQNDGKILVSGNYGERHVKRNAFNLVRLNANGSLDPGFGDAGFVSIKVKAPSLNHKLGLQSDGKIIIGGRSFEKVFKDASSEILVLRLNKNGSLDTSFGTSGKVYLDNTISDPSMDYNYTGNWFGDLAVLKDDKIVVVGSSDIPAGNGHYNSEVSAFSIFRLKTNGSLDTGFNGNGKLLIPTDPYEDSRISKVSVQSNGKILVAGSALNDRSEYTYIAMARVNPEGTIDKSFNNGSYKITGGGAFTEADFDLFDMLVQKDNKILLGGSYGIMFQEYYGQVIRLNADGALDKSFGKGGLILNLPYDEIKLALQQDDKILVASSDYISRFNKDGKLDKVFGNKGYLNNVSASLIKVQPDQKIVLSNLKGEVRRYLNDNNDKLNSEVTRLTLINPSTNEELFDLREESLIDLLSLNLNEVNMKAQISKSTTKVKFNLSGGQFLSSTATKAPFTFFQTTNGSLAWKPQAGNYTLIATPYSVVGGKEVAGKPLVTSFDVIANIPRLERLTLINAKTNQELHDLWNNTTINLEEIGTSEINIRAYTSPDVTGSVVFKLKNISNTSQKDYNHIENTAPYALFKNEGANYLSWKPEVGRYKLIATPYTEKNGKGVKGTSVEMSFEIIREHLDAYLQGVTVINALTNQEVYELGGGTVINLQEIGTDEINFRAYTYPFEIESVQFHLSGPGGFYYGHRDYTPPYEVFKTGGSALSLKAVPGEYSLMVIPYSKNDNPTVNQYNYYFTVVEGQASQKLHASNVYPNPGSGVVNIQYKNVDQVYIFDMTGKEVLKESYLNKESDLLSLDVSRLDNNKPYIIKIISGNEVKNVRWVKE